MGTDEITREAAHFWDDISQRAGLASAIDPNDRRGAKNDYIALVRDRALCIALDELASGGMVVDFGCGTGTFLRGLRQSHPRLTAVGLDISREMLRLAATLDGAAAGRVVNFDGSRLPIRSGAVDAITTGGVLLYLTTKESLVGVSTEFMRTLKPGGLVACVEQVRRQDRPDPVNCKLQRSPESLMEGFREAGFELIEWRQVRRGHFPLVYLIRYGLIPKRWFGRIALLESQLWAGRTAPELDYADALFVFRKPLA